MTHEEWGVGIEAVGASRCCRSTSRDFKASTSSPGGAAHGLHRRGLRATGGSAEFHFPDGNASIARLLVRRLAPQGGSAKDVVTARADHSELDQPNAPVRMRLTGTALKVRNVGDPATAREVEVTYARGGTPCTRRARRLPCSPAGTA